MNTRTSLSDLEKALAAEPFNLLIRRQYRDGLIANERFEDALVQCGLLISQDSSDLESYECKIECLYELRQLPEAKKALEDWQQNAGPGIRSVWKEKLDNSISETLPSLSQVIPIRPDINIIEHTNYQIGISFRDIVGMSELKEEIRLKIIAPFSNPGLFAKFKKSAGGGILLYGPPGCGKTMMAKAISTECQAQFISVGISDILSKYIGESESHLADYFEKARKKKPSVLFFDELDTLGQSRSKGDNGWMKGLVNEFLTQLDGFKSDNESILVLAATNLPWDIDSALLRPGRFARQIFIPPPDLDARSEIFRTKMSDVPNEVTTWTQFAAKTEHYSGADIDGIIDSAKENVLAEILRSNIERPVADKDILNAIAGTKPSTKDWLNTVRTVVKYGGADSLYSDVEAYLKKHKLV